MRVERYQNKRGSVDHGWYERCDKSCSQQPDDAAADAAALVVPAV